MSFQSLAMANKWQQCCADAVACCLENLAIDSFDSQQSFLNVNLNANAVNNQNHDSASCPKTWDGWTCWPNDITIGLTVQQACPAHIYWRMTAPPCRGKFFFSLTHSPRQLNICYSLSLLLLRATAFNFRLLLSLNTQYGAKCATRQKSS